MEVKCKNKACGYKWNYQGMSKFYASCPMCRRVAKLQKNTPQREGSSQ